MIVGTRQAGFSISELADLLGFSHRKVSSVFLGMVCKTNKKHEMTVDQRG